MDKMKFETVDGVDRNVDKIAAVFPQVVTELQPEMGAITCNWSKPCTHQL